MTTIDRDKPKTSPCGEEFPTSMEAISHEWHCDQCAGLVEAMKVDDLATLRTLRASLTDLTTHYTLGSRERAQISAARLAIQRTIISLGDYDKD